MACLDLVCTCGITHRPMACYVFVVIAESPRDGGHVRLFGHFKNERSAWTAVQMFWPLIVEAGDYTTIDVVRTISFRASNRI